MTDQDAEMTAASVFPDSVALPDGGVVRSLTDTSELEAACRLYREVFSYSGEDQGINARLLKNLATYGGTVVGALDSSERIRGLAFGWTAVETDPRDPHVYHFSQAAVVSADFQGRGVGRALKTVQAAVARRKGARRMRWTYNPMISRNAHFNLDVLGAQGRWFTRDALAGPGTDRVTVQWHLDAAEAEAAAALRTHSLETASGLNPVLTPGDLQISQETAVLAVPAQQPTDPATVELLRARFAEIFDDGFVAVSCHRSAEEMALYTFARPSRSAP